MARIVGSGNCLAGCISRYACNPINLPPEWDTASPYVKIKFAQTGNEITVGNASAPCCQDHLVIKSFSYGFSNSYMLEVEIHDEEGGRFHEFIDIMVKCGPKMDDSKMIMEAEWGWIMQTCEGRVTVKSTKTEGRNVQAVAIDLEVSYSEGKIKYRITGQPLIEVMNDFREDKIVGSDGQPVCLQDAIRQLCAIPPAVEVEFLQRDRTGQPVPLQWKIGGTCGPKAVWPMDSQNKLATIAKWVEPFLTEKDKGVFITADQTKYNKIIIWEDQDIICGESKVCADGTGLGTFIANGGRCSNVIEFTPTFNWLKGLNKASSGGNSGSAASGHRELHEELKKCPEKNQGTNSGQETQITITRYAWDVYGPSRATRETGKAIHAQQHANKRYESSGSPIEAQLRIVGDPRKEFVDVFAAGKTLSIVAINPFHIAQTNNGCGDWLAQPGCNQVLSNKSWSLMGADHSIKDGFYETTLKVTLVAPEIDVDSGDPLGGPGSEGYVPQGTC